MIGPEGPKSAGNSMNSREQREAVKRLLGLAQIKQGDYARDVGLSPAALSEALRAEDPRGSPAVYRRIMGGLEMLVRKVRANDRLSAEERNGIDGLYRRALGEKEPEPKREPTLQEPGGWISGDALNYVVREIDLTFDRYLEGVTSPFVLVSGPIQSGRSSAVRRLAAEAEDKGYLAAVVDFGDMVTAAEPWSAESVIRSCYHRLGIEAPGGSVAVGELAAEMASAFRRGLEPRLKEVERGFMVFDSLDMLARTDTDTRQVEQLTWWLTALRNLADQSPFDRLTMIAVTNIVEWPTVQASSAFQGLGRQLMTRKFNETDIRFVSDAYEISDPSSHIIDVAMSEFAGHPFLTHLAIADLSIGQNLEQVRMTARSLDGDYGRHWRRLQQVVKHYCRRHKESEKRANWILTSARDWTNGGLDELSEDDKRILRMIGFIDQREGERGICQFYQAAAKMLEKGAEK